MRFLFPLAFFVISFTISKAQSSCPIDASFTLPQFSCVGQSIPLQGQPHTCSGFALNTIAGSAYGQIQGILGSTLADNFSLDLYVRPNSNSATAGKQVLMRYGSSSGGVQIFISSSNFLQIAIPGIPPLQSTTSLTPLAWQRVVLTKQGTTWALYLNGNPVSLNATNRSLSTVDGQVQVGAEDLFGLSRFQGSIDEARIWLRALNAPETIGGPSACNNPPPGTDQLLAYWNFNEANGAAINQAGTPVDLQLEAGANRVTSAIYKWNIPGSSGVEGINATANLAQPGTYNIGLQVEAPGCTQTNSQTIQVNSQPAITGFQNPTEQTVCLFGSLSLGVLANGNPTGYQWYSSDVPANTGGFMLPGANSQNYVPNTDVPGIKYYYVVVSNPCGSVSSQPLKVEVRQLPLVQAMPLASQTLCQQTAATRLDFVVNSTIPVSYQWFSNGAPVNSGGSPIAGATGPSFTPSSNTAGNFFYYAVASNSCGSVTSDLASVIVLPLPLITQQPTSQQQVCLNTQVFLSVSATAPGNLSYQWFQTTSNTNTGGNPVPGGNGPVLPVPTNAPGTFYYYALVTGDCGAVRSSPAQVVVTAALSFTQQPEPTVTVCAGANRIISVAATGTAPVAYQWFSNTINSNTGGTPLQGQTTQNLTLPVSEAGIKYYYAMAIDQCGSQSSSVSAVEVLPLPFINSMVGSAGCIGSSLSPIGVLATGTGLSYQWYLGAGNSNTGGTLINGATNFTYNPPSSQAGTTYYYAVVSNSCGATVSSTIPVVVNPLTAITTQPANSLSLCFNGASQALTVAATGTGTLSYQWYSHTSNTNTGGTAITGANTASYQPPTGQAGTFYYYAVATSDCGAATSAVSTVTVLNPPQILAQPLATQTICQNTTAAPLTVSASGTGTLSYQWFVNTSNSVAGANAISGANNSSYTPPTNATGNWYYFVQVSNGTCQPLNSAMALVRVNVAVIDVSGPANGLVCSEGAVNQLQAKASDDYSVSATSSNLGKKIPDFNATGINDTLTISDFDQSLGVDSVIVSFTIYHPFAGDLIINLQAPNGRIINLVSGKGSSGGNFVNTRISSDPGRNAIPATGAPYTGTFRADAVIPAFGTPLPNTQAFADLFGTVNGQWKLWVYDRAGSDTGYLANWSIKVASARRYTNVVWAPNGPGSGLYTDATASTVYTGTPVSSVYAKLDGYSKAYTVSTNINGCAATGSYTLARTNFVEITSASSCEGAPITGNISGAAGMLKWLRNGTVQAIQKDSAYDNTGFTIKDNIAPNDMAMDTAGNIYYTDPNAHAVFQLPKGSSTPIVVAGGNGSGNAANQLSYPGGLFIEKNGNLYIADYNNNRIQKWVPGATQGTTVASGMSRPVAVFVDQNGIVFVTEYDKNRVSKWGGGFNGAVVAGNANGYWGSDSSSLNYPVGIYVDSTGNLYVADQLNHRIQRWAPGATKGVTVAGGNGNRNAGILEKQTIGPVAVNMDKAGNLYIAEYGYSRISKWKPGAVSGTTIVNNYGDPQYTNGYTNFVFDADSILYVSDYQKKRIQRFLPKGPLPGTAILNATTSGLYQAIVINSNGCTDTSNVIAIGTEADKGYFRTVGTGSWSNPATWQTSSDNKLFLPACQPPGVQAVSIEVRPQHTITVSQNISIKKLNVQTGGAVNVTNGAKVEIIKQ